MEKIMSLSLYIDSSENTPVGTSLSDSYIIGHNRRTNHPVVKKVFVRNDSTSHWYSGVSIQCTSTNISVEGNDGFGIKFYNGELEPTERQWNQLDYNYPAKFNNIGTSGSFDTSFDNFFWMRVEVASTVDVARYDGNFLISFTEHSV